MTTEKRNENNKEARPGVIDTIIQLGAATTNLAIDQVGNALTAIVHPGKAIDHVKETLMNLSDAMNTSAGTSRSEAATEVIEVRPVSDLRGASDGMEYVATERLETPVVEVRRATTKTTPNKINHRKA